MMTKTEKLMVRAWRIKGESYSEIAEKLNVTFGSVRSYCYRNGMSDAEMKNYSSCIVCGKPVEWSGKGLRRMYCSPKCGAFTDAPRIPVPKPHTVMCVKTAEKNLKR